MPVLGVEPVMDELKTQLSTFLPAKIAALEQTFVPLITMPAPKAYVFGERDILYEGLPSLQLIPRPTQMRYEDLRWQDHVHVVDVALFASEVDQETVQRLLLRYTRCILETLIERRKADAFGWTLVLRDREIDYSPFEVLGPSQIVRAVFIPVAATRRAEEKH